MISYLNAIKWIIPAIILFLTAPSQVFVLLIWRLLTIPFPKKTYEDGEEIIWAMYQWLVLFCYELYSGMKLLFYDDAKEIFKKKENILFIMNHQSALDWVVVDMLAVRQGSAGYIRYILKDELRYIPLYGAYFYQHYCIYVKRRGQFEEEKALNTIKEIDNKNKKFWLILFPEGTRYSLDKVDLIKKSEQFAKDQGLETLQYHLTPRYRAGWLCVNNLRHKIDAIYDVTTVYGNSKGKRVAPPGLFNYFDQSTKDVHISLKRIDIKDVPADLESFKLWLHNIFVEKDKLLNRFFGKASVSAESYSLSDHIYSIPISRSHFFAVFLVYLAVNGVMYFTFTGRCIILSISIFGSLIGCLWMKFKS